MAEILIVEDDPASREYLRTVLEYGGHTVIEAADGVEGLEKVRARHPDPIVCDVLMPKMDGFQFVRELRADAALADTRVIFWTATYNREEAAGLAAVCGVEEVLGKPAEPETILSAVETVLRKPRRMRPLPSADAFQREHLQLLLEKLYLKARVEETNERLSELVRVVQSVATEQLPDRLLQEVCGAASQLVGAASAAIVLLPPHDRRQHCYQSGACDQPGFCDGPESRRRLERLAPKLLAQVPPSTRSARFDDSEGLFGSELDFLGGTNRALLLATICSSNELYGLLVLAGAVHQDRFSGEDESIALTLCSQFAVAYENLLRYEELKNRAEALEREVADRKRAEANLRQSEARFRQLLEAAPDGMVIVDQKGRIVLVNAQAEKLFGYTREDLLSKELEVLVPERFRAELEAYRSRYISDSYGRASGANMDLHGARQDGTEFPINVSLSLLETEEGVLVTAAIRDVSERRALEMQFRQAQKMEAVGRLAGGIAHDFNNLLMVISGYAELMVARRFDEAAMRKHAEQVLETTRKASGVVQQLLAFSRMQTLHPAVLDLNRLVRNLDQMLPRLLGEDVELVVSTEDNLGRVKADPGQIEQVIMNMAVNARDAMPQGGTLTIATTKVELAPGIVREHVPVAPGPYIVLSISDTGEGMDAGTRSQIFEPFFTTKEKGKGTGLGLATAYGIVKQSGGYIWVDSEPGQGATFRIYLPQVDEPARQETSRPAAEEAPQGSETVLLVEDEDSLRAVLCEFLKGRGYTVLPAADGREALRVCHEHQGTIHVLLTDMVMPAMPGIELARKVLALRPATRIMCMSGYTDRPMEVDKLAPGVVLLQKPFKLSTLAQELRNVLDHKPAAAHA
jgi:hypothetical protein